MLEQDVGAIAIPKGVHIYQLTIKMLHRKITVSGNILVTCSTETPFGFSLPPGTASGTVPTSVLSYSDYISRPEDHTSVVRFDKDEREKMCRIVIIDDSLYEEEETFHVRLSMPMGGRIGSEFPEARVTIVPDKDDGKY